MHKENIPDSRKLNLLPGGLRLHSKGNKHTFDTRYFQSLSKEKALDS